jgi:drug/metabolite transporter (DMT)-like permease
MGGMRMTRLDWVLLAVLSVLWGGSFVFAKVAVQALPPMTVVLARVSLAAVALGLFLRLRGTSLPRGGAAWRPFFAMGALNNLVPFALIFWSQTVIGSGLAAVLNATTPIFALLAAHALTADETLTPRRLLGAGLGVAGVAVLVGAAALSGADRALPPILACLGAALSYGLASVYGRRFRAMGLDPVVGAFGQVAATSAMALPLVLLLDAPWRLPMPGVAVWAALAALAVVSTAVAYVIYFRLLATAGAVNASLVTLLVPVSATLLGAALLGERLTGPNLAGMGLIGLGLLVIDGRVFAAPYRT